MGLPAGNLAHQICAGGDGSYIDSAAGHARGSYGGSDAWPFSLLR